MIDSAIFSLVDEGAIGKGGDINITTNDLSLTQGGLLNASTFGQEDAGAITINASGTISIDGENQMGGKSGIFSTVEESAVGNAGVIDINTSSLFVANKAEILAQTRGEGRLGTLEINAAELVEVRGLESGLFNRNGGTGDPGTVTITTPELRIIDNSQIGANNFIEIGFQIKPLKDDSGKEILNRNGAPITRVVPIINPSEGSGNAGKLEVKADSLQLENGGRIVAESAGGDGGNINLKSNLLSFRNGSNVSATAGLENTPGSGGNINIDSTLIVAFPNQNNDITANASEGNGGNINITTEGIFGLGVRPDNPQTNDIDASGIVDGVVTIITPNTDITQELEQLSSEVVDLDRLIAKNLCQRGDKSEFIITGKGGMAPSPSEPRDGEISEVDLVEPAPFVEDWEVEERSESSLEVQQASEDNPLPEEEIVQAQGWIINEQGKVRLVAYKTDPNTSSTQPTDTEVCHQ